MAKITRKDVEEIAALAHLELTAAEKKKFATQLEAILAYAECIDALDTEGVEATSHALLRDDAFRDDEEAPCLSQDEVLRLAPKSSRKTPAKAVKDGLVKVPKVIP